MITRILLISIVTFMVSPLVAQSSDATLPNIRASYAFVKQHIADFDTTRIMVWDESTEGGEATAFFLEDELKMIRVWWLNETGRIMVEFYVDKGQLIFAFKQMITYNRPITWTEDVAQSNGETIAFDSSLSIIEEDRFYFEDRKLFLWINPQKENVDLAIQGSQETEEWLLNTFAKRKNEIQ